MVPPQAPPTKSSKLPLIIAGVALIALVVVAIIAFLLFGRSTVLDQSAVQSGVKSVLTESYGLQDVSNVQCPSGQKVKAGNTFVCTVTVDGQSKTTSIKIIDSKGTYEVAKPQ